MDLGLFARHSILSRRFSSRSTAADEKAIQILPDAVSIDLFSFAFMNLFGSQQRYGSEGKPETFKQHISRYLHLDTGVLTNYDDFEMIQTHGDSYSILNGCRISP
jgi:hypothetical protein